MSARRAPWWSGVQPWWLVSSEVPAELTMHDAAARVASGLEQSVGGQGRSANGAARRRPGPTASPPTGAAMATPVPPVPAWPGRRTPKSGKSLPHLAAVAILVHRPAQAQSSSRRSIARVTTPAQAADLIDGLRTAGITLTYDPGPRTLRCSEDIAVTIGYSR